MMQSKNLGFTLIELMIVVAILGILAAIAIPRFSRLIAKSQESTTKGNLGAIRAALSIYYAECEAIHPSDNLASLTAGEKFLPEMPRALLPLTPYNINHGGPFTGVLIGAIPGGSNDVSDGVSGWLYDNTGNGSTWGQVIVNCIHADYFGTPWTSY